MIGKWRTASFIVLVIALLIILPVAAKADNIQTIGEYSGNYHLDPGPYDLLTVVGTFNILAGDASATISGFFGNSVFSNSSGVDVYLASAGAEKHIDLLVAQCIEGPGACYTGSTSTMWSYTLTGAQLASLGTGFVDLSALQTSQFVVRLGVTTQVPAPEPTSLMLLGISTIGVSVWRKFLA
jgi:hypothetical protein